MSTPIHQLPPSAVAPPTDDPEVLSMLNDMEREVQEATRSQHTAMPMRPPATPVHAPVPTPTVVKKAAPKGLWDPSLAQKAAVYAVLGMIVFYPATLQFVYSKVPKFEAAFTSYDFLIRAIVLAVVLYFALMYLPM